MDVVEATSARASQYQCRDCESWWDSQLAADECEIIDAAETRAARREKH